MEEDALDTLLEQAKLGEQVISLYYTLHYLILILYWGLCK
jgi:hypothetical protein